MKKMHKVRSIALVVGAVAALASVAVAATYYGEPQQLARVKNVAGIYTPDSSAFTIEFSNASTLSTPDTVESFFIGDMNYVMLPIAGTALNMIRVSVTGIPQLVACDTLGAYIDFANSKNGPWYGTGITGAYAITLLNPRGAGAADTTGWGAFLAAGTVPTVETNVWSGTLTVDGDAVASSTTTTEGWAWARLRLSGDHGGSAPLGNARVYVSVPRDLVPQIRGGSPRW